MDIHEIKKILLAFVASITYLSGGWVHAHLSLDLPSAKAPSIDISCPHYDSSKQVIYIDDAGYPAPDRDPNGIQDLAIVVALDQVHPEISLLAIGISEESSGINDIGSSVNLAKKITVAAGQPKLPVYGATDSASYNLEKQIIFHARCLNTAGQKLYIAIGGEWAPLQRAIERDKTIASNLSVVGITGSNIDRKSGKKQAYDFIASNIPDNRIVLIGREKFRKMYSPGPPPYETSDALNEFYNRNLLPVLRHIIDKDGINITDKNAIYITHTITVNPGTHYLRIADFMTIAHLIWNGDPGVYNQTLMFDRIEAAFKSLSSNGNSIPVDANQSNSHPQ